MASEDRLQTVAGDLLEADFGTGHQIATIGHILHSEGRERSRQLLHKTFAALAPGGTIVISEFLPNEESDRAAHAPDLRRQHAPAYGGGGYVHLCGNSGLAKGGGLCKSTVAGSTSPIAARVGNSALAVIYGCEGGLGSAWTRMLRKSKALSSAWIPM